MSWVEANEINWISLEWKHFPRQERKEPTKKKKWNFFDLLSGRARLVGLLSFLLWVMGGSRPPMLRNKEDEQSKTNQTIWEWNEWGSEALLFLESIWIDGKKEGRHDEWMKRGPTNQQSWFDLLVLLLFQFNNEKESNQTANQESELVCFVWFALFLWLLLVVGYGPEAI